MKINGVEQVNIGTEEEPYWIPKENPFPIEKLENKPRIITATFTKECFDTMISILKTTESGKDVDYSNVEKIEITLKK